jgi:hypothetical protein
MLTILLAFYAAMANLLDPYIEQEDPKGWFWDQIA